MFTFRQSVGRRSGFLAQVALILPLVAGAAFAGKIGVSVGNIQVSNKSIVAGLPIEVSYVLGGSGIHLGEVTSVKIEILSGTTVVKSVTINAPATGTQRGLNTVPIDTTGIPTGGPYDVRVTVSVNKASLTTTEWQQVSDSTDPAMQFYNPRGVDVNRNAGSPALGRIYVTEGEAGNTGGRTTMDGVYVLNPDLSETFPGDEPRARTSGTNGGPWAGSTNSPHRVTVGPDDSVYIADWSDPHSGIFITDRDVTTVEDLLIFPFPEGGQRGSPTIGDGIVLDSQGREIYSSTSGIWVEGTGANRKIFTADYYMTPMGSIWRHDIPAGTTRWSQPPTVVIPNAGQINSDSYHDLVRDSAGNYYIVNSTGTDESFKYDSAGNQVSQLVTGTMNYGVAIDDARNRIAVGTTDGQILLTNKTFAAATPIVTGLGPNVRDVAWDAEGWLYAVNSSDSRMYVYAPAGTWPVSGGTATLGQVLTVISVPLPGDIAPVGPSGVNVGTSGQRYGDGKVDILDSVYSLRVAAGLATIP